MYLARSTGTIKHKLDNGAYGSHDEFADDVRTTFANAMLYNAPLSEIYGLADRLNKRFEEVCLLLSGLLCWSQGLRLSRFAAMAPARPSNGQGSCGDAVKRAVG